MSSRTNESHPACEFDITAINITCQVTILKNLKIKWMDTVNFFDGSVYSPPPPHLPPRKQEKRRLCLNRVKSLKTQAQKRFKRSLSRLRKRGSGGREGSVHQTKIDLYNMLLKFYGFVVIDDELSYCSLNSPPFALVTFYRPLLFLTEKSHLKINFFLQNTEITTLS